jgi:hypothetical protein
MPPGKLDLNFKMFPGIINLGSSNGRTAAFGAVSGGSNPPLRTSIEITMVYEFRQ